MKRLLTFLTLLTLFFTSGWAAESVYKSLTFTSTTMQSNVQNYTSTWNTICDGFTWTLVNFNNNNRGWTYVKTGGKSAAMVGTITTAASIDKAITKVEVTVDALKSSYVNSAKLYVASDADFTTDVQEINVTPATGTMTYAIPTPTANMYYKLAYDCKKGTNSTGNGLITISKVEYYYNEGGTQTVATPTITLDPASGSYYEGDNVTATLACETQGATIYYKLNDDASWTEYSTALTLTQTSTIHAKAVLGTDESSEKTQTVTFKKSVANIAAFKALSDTEAADFKFTGDVVVTYFNENNADYLWIKDNTGSTLLYQSNLTSNVEQGDIIGGGWTGNRTIYKGLVEIKGVTDAAIAQGSETVNPIDLNYTDHFTSTDFQSVYGKLSGVKITAKQSNGNFTITDANDNEINGHDTYGLTWPNDFSEKTYNIIGIVSVYTNPQFIPVAFEEVQEDPGDGYYLVGNFNMDGNNWVAKDARYKFSGDGTSLTLNNVTLPDDVQFKIVKWEGTTQTWYGGLTQDDNQQNPYGLHRDWHTNIPLTNSYNNNYVKNFSIAAGAVTNFTLNTSTLKFDVQRDEQLYVKGDFNEWGKTPMNSTSTGWTINQAISAEDEFGFVDEWGDWHGGDGYWIYQEEHEAFGETKPSDIGQELDITSSENFYMVTAGTYTLNVNSNLTKLVVYVPLAINCTATSDVEGKAGGTVVAKVEGNTVTAAQTGETVVLEVTPWNGYTLSSVTLNGSALTANEGVYSFEMPNVAANVVANFTVNYYDLVLQNDETLGEVSGLPQNMKAYTGQEVSFSVTALGENEIDKVTYEYNGGNPQTLTATEGTYKFNMPPFEVTIKVTYIEPLQPCTIRFEESWPETAGLGGNDDVWSTSGNSPAAVSQNLGWIYKDGDTEFQGYGADNCIRIGKRNGAGSATTPEIIVTNGTIYKMTFRAGGWTSDNTTINLSAEGAELFSDANCTTSIETETITSESWTEFEVYVKATSSLMRITWAAPPTRSRFFLDDVVIDFFETPLPTEATLAQIITLGENADGKLYKISNEDGLLGVYSQGQSVWFKDEYPEQAVDYQDPLENTNYKYYTVVEDALEINKSEKDFDQSNWIEVVFQDNASYNNKYVKNLTGTYSWQNGNPKLTLTVDVDETNDVTDVPVGALAYDLNPYMAANFAGTQDGTIQGETHTYFFSKPKAQEYAQILWAVWDGSKFNMPTTNNAYGFTGSFTVSDELNGGVSLDGLQQGETYNFKAVIRKTESKAGSYEVYPTDLNPGVVTGVGMINVNGNVKSVKYVNVAGIVSDVPFQGVNIVVTEYTDGSRTTTKMLRK